jgi:hypothetical protein
MALTLERHVLGTAHEVLEAFEGEGHVGAALGGGEGVDLVDDHGLDIDQRGAGLRGEHQVERFGSGDEDVGWAADERPALLRGGVAGAHPDAGRGVGITGAGRGQLDAPQG